MPHSGSDDGCHELLISLDRLKMLFWTLITSLAAALIGLGVYIYALQSGQLDDAESIKYQLFHEDNPDG